MPRIREYSSQTTSPVLSNFTRLRGEDISTVGNGLMVAGRGAREVADSMAKREEERQEFEARKLAMKEQQDLTTTIDEMRKNAPPGAEGFTKQVMTELDQRRAKAMEGAGSEHMRKAIDISFSQIHLNVSREAQGFESESMAKKQRQDLEGIFDTNNNLVRANPARVEEFVESEIRLLEKTPLDQTFKQGWITKRKQELFDSAFDGEVSKFETGLAVTSAQVGQYLASAKAEGSRWVAGSSPDGYQNGIKRLERLQETLKTKEQQQIFADFDEKMDQLQSTGVRTPENVYTKEWIQKNVPDPQKKEMMLKREAIATEVGTAMTFVKDAPADEINKELEKVASLRTSTGEFHVTDAKYQALIQAKKNRDQAFVKDPAAYTVGISPALQKLSDELANSPSPEKADQYASLMAAEQRRLYPGVQPKILNENEIGRISSMMKAVSFDEKGAGETVQALQGEMDKWGKWWPHVVRDLRAGKALNDSQYVAASMLDKPHLKHVAEEMVKAASVPRKQILKELPEGSEKAAYTSAMDSLADFKKSLGAMPNGDQVAASYANAITQVALYKQSRGEDVNISDIADQVINSSYEFEDTYRIPKTVQNTSSVRTGANLVMANISEQMDFASLPRTTGQTNFMKPEDIKKRYADSVRRDGKIVTKGDDSGIRVIDSIGNQVYVNKNGKPAPLEYTWAELETMGLDRQRKVKDAEARRK